MTKPQPWSPADATIALNALGRNRDLDVHLTDHALDQMEDRELIMTDLLAVLRRGFVYQQAVEATRGFYKYEIEAKTPNSGTREVRLVLIPDPQQISVKIVTIMWVDEVRQ